MKAVLPALGGATWWAGAPIELTIAFVAAWLLGSWAPVSLARWRMATSQRYAALLDLGEACEAGPPISPPRKE